jgi:hypothetical protein
MSKDKKTKEECIRQLTLKIRKVILAGGLEQVIQQARRDRIKELDRRRREEEERERQRKLKFERDLI